MKSEAGVGPTEQGPNGALPVSPGAPGVYAPGVDDPPGPVVGQRSGPGSGPYGPGAVDEPGAADIRTVASAVASAVDGVRQLVAILSGSDVLRVAVSAGPTRLELERRGPAPAAAAPSSHPSSVPAAATGEGAVDDAEQARAGAASATVVTAPLVGIFYRAPAPGAPAFAEVGTVVRAGQQLAIVEAMKTMNEVVAPCSGTVVAVDAGDGEVVEFGQPLLTVLPG